MGLLIKTENSTKDQDNTMDFVFEYPYLNPPVFQLGPIAPRWYALMYIIGFVFTYFIISKHPAYTRRGLTKDDAMDYLTYGFVGVIAGGRLGYVLFYNFGVYLKNPLSILAVWQGGMSFHGGLLGVIIATLIYSRRKKIPLLTMLDIVALPTPIGLFFGRIGNFINGELWGKPTDGSWGVKFVEAQRRLSIDDPTQLEKIFGPPRHPTQLYEAGLEGLALLLVLWLATRLTYRSQKLKPGSIGALFLMGYGAARFAVEFWRIPDQHIGYLWGTDWLTMGHVLSTPMIIGGLLMLIVANMIKGPAAIETELTKNPISPPDQNEDAALPVSSELDAVAAEVSFPESTGEVIPEATDELQVSPGSDVSEDVLPDDPEKA